MTMYASACAPARCDPRSDESCHMHCEESMAVTIVHVATTTMVSSSSLTPYGDLQILDSSYIPECAKVMAEAFSESPSYIYIFRGTKDYRVNALEWVFERNLRLTVGKCPSALRGVLEAETSQVICCFLWTPAEHSDLKLWEMIRAGLWQLPIRFGYPTLNRLLNLMGQMEAAGGKPRDGNIQTGDVAQSSPAIKYRYIMLERMAVRPTWQGKGLGTKALRAILQEEQNKLNCLDDGANIQQIQIQFETQEDRNVRFYSRLGFAVDRDGDFYEQDPEYKFHSWHMSQTIRKQHSG
jgi:GNAT superfamily N-acetyltransferase